MRKYLLAAMFSFMATSCLASSVTYQLTGACDNTDMVYRWSIDGRAGANGATTTPALTNTPTVNLFPNWPAPGQPGSSFVFPFTPYDILIYAIEIEVVSGLPSSFYMSGNAYDGDTMLFAPSGANYGRHDFAPGHEFKLPGYATSHASNLAYVDLHGACSTGSANILYVIYYIKDPASP